MRSLALPNGSVGFVFAFNVLPTLVFFSLIFPREADNIKRHPRLSWLIFLPYFLHLVVVLLSIDSSILDVGDFSADGLFGPFVAVVKMALVLITGFLSLLVSAHIQLWAGVNVLYVGLALYFLWRTGKVLSNRRLQTQVLILQVGFRLRLRFRFNRLNALKGLRRMLGRERLVDGCWMESGITIQVPSLLHPIP